MSSVNAYLWVGLGSALGGMGRLWVLRVVAHRLETTYPWGTLCVNVSGSLVIGILAAWLMPDGGLAPHPAVRHLLFLGFLGGFTTFSSFSLQTLQLLHRGEWLLAGFNVFASVTLCLIAVTLGYYLGRSL